MKNNWIILLLLLAVSWTVLPACHRKRCPSVADTKLSQKQIRKNRLHQPDMRLFPGDMSRKFKLKGD